MDVANDELVSANVDRARLGDNWPMGLVQLIEAHEKKHCGIAARKQVHVLIDRYVARYLPGTVVEWAHRGSIIRALRDRYFLRLRVYWVYGLREKSLARMRTSMGASAPIASVPSEKVL